MTTQSSPRSLSGDTTGPCAKVYSPLKILVIISEAPPIRSGVSRVGEEIIKRLRSAGHVVDTVSNSDIPRLALGEVRLSSMLWKGVGSVFRRVKEYDLIHVHGPAPTFSDVALIFTSLRRVIGGPPIVYTHHSEIELPGKEVVCSPYNYAHRALARLADHVVVSTPSYARSFAPFLPQHRISAIPWGVSHRQASSTKPDGFNILFVGQLRPYKGVEVLLRAFSRTDNAKLTIIGNGHAIHRYRAQVQELGLRNVHFLGKVTERVLRRAYDEAHALVLPSLTRAEAFGLVLLEGMAFGCVPIASRLPGLTDVVGDAGYTFEPGDDAALASILTSLQHDRAAMESLSQAAWRRADTFCWDRTAQAYERLFTALVRGSERVVANWFPCYSLVPLVWLMSVA